MKFLIAPDSFKESMTAKEACQAIARGIRLHRPDADIICQPLADGGEGSLDVLTQLPETCIIEQQVSGPLFTPVMARIGIIREQTGVIEMAEAAGLHRVPRAQRNPGKTTTYGVGQMILTLLDRGIRNFEIALGGSATNDGGLGLLVALGARALDYQGQPLAPVGESLIRIASIDLQSLDPRLQHATFRLACDVDNPLTGPTGAAAVFGPQKGASADQVRALDAGLCHWSELLFRVFGRQVADIPGSGAAGGLAAAFLAAFDATLTSGIEQILDQVRFDARCADVDWVITGEGSLDGQSLAGKVPLGVARRARRAGVPVIALAGTLGQDYEALYPEGIHLALAITPDGMTLTEALKKGPENLTQATLKLMQLLYPD